MFLNDFSLRCISVVAVLGCLMMMMVSTDASWEPVTFHFCTNQMM